jgi:large subunit ribosomal protein L9
MKVIFLKDILPTAMAGDVKEVKTGFARNYLIPKGIAVLATKSTMDQVTKLQKEAQERRLVESKKWEEKAKSLKEKTLTITVQTGPTGRLYGSVTNTLVADKIEEETGIQLDRRNIRFPDPIRMIGNYKVPVKLYEGISIDLGLKVVSDGTNLEEEVFEITDTESKTVTENKEVDENDEKSNQITSTEEESLKETDVKNNTADVPEKNTEKEEKKD